MPTWHWGRASRFLKGAMPDKAATMPAYVEARIREPIPPDCCVLPYSTPVVAFGNPQRSRVATLGLNPSRVEFEVRGVELDGALRRFETLRSLGIEQLTDAPTAVVEQVWQRCNNYFHGNPYRWFTRLEEVLQAVEASYYTDTACHLDLTQWATDPTWNGLERSAQQRLVRDDAAFLKTQLRAEPITLVLLNGRSVLRAFERVLGGRLQRSDTNVADASVTTTLHTGEIESVRVIGWSTNLQSSFGVTRELRAKLARAVAQLAAQ
jgi:hypothetical protein